MDLYYQKIDNHFQSTALKMIEQSYTEAEIFSEKQLE